MTDYGHRRFTDLHGQYIDPDETLTLKQALDNLAAAQDKVARAYDEDGKDYASHRLEADRNAKIAAENFDAALFRATGYWGHDLRRLGAC